MPVNKFAFVLLQLQQMVPAGQSGEVAMKNHQEPRAPVILEPMNLAVEIREGKRNSRLPNPIQRDLLHALLHCRHVRPLFYA